MEKIDREKILKKQKPMHLMAIVVVVGLVLILLSSISIDNSVVFSSSSLIPVLTGIILVYAIQTRRYPFDKLEDKKDKKGKTNVEESETGETKNMEKTKNETKMKVNTCPIERRPPCATGFEQRKNNNGDECCFEIFKEDTKDVKSEIAKEVGKTALVVAGTSAATYKALGKGAAKGRKIGREAIKSVIKTKNIVTRKIVATKVGQKLSRALISKLSKIARGTSQATFLKLIKNAAAKTGKAVGKFAAKQAAKWSAAGAAVIATPVASAAVAAFNIATIVFDATSLALDLGDPGGYDKLEFLYVYKKTKEELDRRLQDDAIANGESYPIVVGPLDQLDEESIQKLMEAAFQVIIENKVLDGIITEIEDESEGKSEEEIEALAEQKLNKYLTENEDNLFNEAYQSVCNSNGGKIVEVTRSVNGKEVKEPVCTYATKDICHNYPWPIPANATEDQFLNVRRWVDNKCVLEDPTIRMMCDENQVGYNFENGLCQITEEYCRKKGADYKYNDKIKMNDCFIEDGQKFAEFIFGKTITRGLIQVFDPKQYESCKPGEKDDGYFCRNLKCKQGDGDDGGLCYPKCKDGYTGAGPVCWEKCPPGYTSDGATCRRAGYCPPDKERNGALCYPKCRDGYTGNGPVCWEKCPRGYTNDGATCRRAGYCPPGKERDGALCYPKCRDGYTGNGPVCWEKCPPGYINDGATCRKPLESIPKKSAPAKKRDCAPGLRDDGTSCWSDAHIIGRVRAAGWNGSCRSDEDKRCEGICGASLVTCYKKCPPGYANDGLTCRKTDVGIKQNLFQRQYCEPGYTNVAGVCWENCPAGYTDDGAFCRKGGEVVAKKSYGRGAGTPDTHIISKKSYGRGAGTPDTHIISKKSYGRGVGYIPETKIRMKQRRIEYGKK